MKNIKNIDKVCLLISFATILVFDQITKVIVAEVMQLYSSHTVIDNFFYFTYVLNTGAAWSMFEGQITFFILIAIVAGIGMIYYFIQTKPHERLTRYGLVIAFSGLIGNVIDRICFGYVRDFLDFVIFGYDFPIFNIADMGLVIGFGLIMLEMLYEGDNHG